MYKCRNCAHRSRQPESAESTQNDEDIGIGVHDSVDVSMMLLTSISCSYVHATILYDDDDWWLVVLIFLVRFFDFRGSARKIGI